jgi:hypothetical protein
MAGAGGVCDAVQFLEVQVGVVDFLTRRSVFTFRLWMVGFLPNKATVPNQHRTELTFSVLLIFEDRSS